MATPVGRLDGLDLARFLAFAGMVLVNFSVFVGVAEDDLSFAASFLTLFQGKAAATFVVLAGLGLGLAWHRGQQETVRVTLKRALFLFVIGLLNMQIFDADILHYYAVWFALATLCFAWSSARLKLGIWVLLIAAFVLHIVLDYDAGWDWTTLTYTDLWTVGGFLRNLFYNGWHPVIPWFAFILFGLRLSRLNLANKSVQRGLIVKGAAYLLIAEVFARAIGVISNIKDEDLLVLLGVRPVPPGILYMIVGMASASLVTGLCLRLSSHFWFHRITAWLRLAGRQSLTLYIAHIFIGMGVMEAMGLEGDGSASLTLQASLLFLVGTILYARAWLLISRRGPLELLMRKVAG